MNWQEDHQEWVSQLPAKIRKAHQVSSNHRASIEEREKCGCFYCCTIFSPEEIQEWIDEDENGKGQTALCPHCGIDSIIGSSSNFPIDIKFLQEMRNAGFKTLHN